MSRYLILLIFNLPFILLSILSAITRYKLHRSSAKRCLVQISIWLAVLLGLIMMEPLYNWLFRHQMTQTEPLSLFDVAQITAIVVVFYVANRSHTKVETLERRVQDLHQELSIRLSEKK